MPPSTNHVSFLSYRSFQIYLVLKPVHFQIYLVPEHVHFQIYLVPEHVHFQIYYIEKFDCFDAL